MVESAERMGSKNRSLPSARPSSVVGLWAGYKIFAKAAGSSIAKGVASSGVQARRNNSKLRERQVRIISQQNQERRLVNGTPARLPKFEHKLIRQSIPDCLANGLVAAMNALAVYVRNIKSIRIACQGLQDIGGDGKPRVIRSV